MGFGSIFKNKKKELLAVLEENRFEYEESDFDYEKKFPPPRPSRARKEKGEGSQSNRKKDKGPSQQNSPVVEDYNHNSNPNEYYHPNPNPSKYYQVPPYNPNINYYPPDFYSRDNYHPGGSIPKGEKWKFEACENLLGYPSNPNFMTPPPSDPRNRMSPYDKFSDEYYKNIFGSTEG